MRAGIVVLPEHRWWVAEPKWRAVEEYGFDHAWTYDHLGWRTLVDGPWFSAMPTLTAAAMVTSRIRLGTFVATPNYRHPVPFARELLALDDISDGRLVLGVGSGGGQDGYDTTVLGGPRVTPRARAERFGEFVELLDLLLTRDRTTWRGEHYSAVDARSAPGCVQHPRAPFVVAANGPKAMQVAARFGQGWVTTGESRDDEEAWWRSLGELSARFDDTLAEVGRASTSVDRYLQLDASPSYSLASVERFRDAVGRAADLGFTDVIAHWPRPEGIYAGHESVLEEVADEVLPELDRIRSLD